MTLKKQTFEKKETVIPALNSASDLFVLFKSRFFLSSYVWLYFWPLSSITILSNAANVSAANAQSDAGRGVSDPHKSSRRINPAGCVLYVFHTTMLSRQAVDTLSSLRWLVLGLCVRVDIKRAKQRGREGQSWVREPDALLKCLSFA